MIAWELMLGYDLSEILAVPIYYWLELRLMLGCCPIRKPDSTDILLAGSELYILCCSQSESLNLWHTISCRRSFFPSLICSRRRVYGLMFVKTLPSHLPGKHHLVLYNFEVLLSRMEKFLYVIPIFSILNVFEFHLHVRYQEMEILWKL